jgi:membrane dipeptidase
MRAGGSSTPPTQGRDDKRGEDKPMARDLFTADMHVHVSGKIYLLPWIFRKQFHHIHKAYPGFRPLGMRADLPSLREGGVDLMLQSISIPERRLVGGCWQMWLAALFSWRATRATFSRRPYRWAVKSILHLEKAVEKARRVMGDVVEVAHGKAQLQRILNEGKLAILHSVEGGHHLGGSLEHLDRLFNLGVCLITLAHHFPNGLVPPVRGIPDDYGAVRMGCYRWRPDLTLGLTPPGRQVVEHMIDLGMLIDLTHATPPARHDILSLCELRGFPAVMSHNGAAGVFNNPMNPTDGEIRRIADLGGVIGVIFMNYWLAGASPGTGIDHILDTMEHLYQTGGEECVAIGSDYEGLTDPPDDLIEPSAYPTLADAVIARFGVTLAEKFLGLNLLRVIQEYWGKP